MIKIKGLGILEEVYDDNTEFLTRTRYHFKDDRLFTEPKIKKICEMGYADYIGTLINKNFIPFKWNGVLVKTTHNKSIIKNTIDLNDLNFWWFVGRVLADGWCISHKRNFRNDSYTHKVVLCCGKHEITEVKERIDKLKYKATLSEERTVYKFTINNHELWAFMSLFGKYAYGKFIPQEIIDMPVMYLKQLLEGYFSGDGYKDKRGNQTMITVSKQLAFSLKESIIKVYNTPVKLYLNKSRNHVIEGRKVVTKDGYHLVFKMEKCLQDKAFSDGEYIWSPLSKIEPIGEKLDINIVVELALKCKNKTEFKRKYKNAFDYANKHKILDEVCLHMMVRTHTLWSYDLVMECVGKSLDNAEFIKKYSSGYCYARRNNMYGEINEIFNNRRKQAVDAI